MRLLPSQLLVIALAYLQQLHGDKYQVISIQLLGGGYNPKFEYVLYGPDGSTSTNEIVIPLGSPEITPINP